MISGLSYQGLREKHLKHHAFTEVIWMEVSLLDEVQGADIGDKRLNRRLGRVVEELGANPNLSIPAATNARAEMEGAYRFFANDKVSPEKILGPHSEATRARISQNEIVLLVQDTTEFDLSLIHIDAADDSVLV